MVKLIPVQYRNLSYPHGIQPQYQEIAGHFDKDKIHPKLPFSLHTEYSHSGRKWKNRLICEFPELCRSQKKGIPLLWYSERWPLEFAEFLKKLCGNHKPAVIEIHPPYQDYCSLPVFIERYRIFEDAILSAFPSVQILLENRSGTNYQGQFIISEANSLIDLSNQIVRKNLGLKIALDIPQLFTAHSLSIKKYQKIPELLDSLRDIRQTISGVHLWGKNDVNGRRTPHAGDLNTYFYGRNEMKQLLLESMRRLLDDNVPRYFVPEVNSFDGSDQQNLNSIVSDLLDAGFCFPKLFRYRIWAKTDHAHLWTYEQFREAVGGILLNYQMESDISNLIADQVIQTEQEIPQELFDEYQFSHQLLDL